jgi:hypothetical protein
MIKKGLYIGVIVLLFITCLLLIFSKTSTNQIVDLLNKILFPSLALLLSVGAIFLSINANKKNTKLNRKIFQKSHIFDLYMQWSKSKNMNLVDKSDNNVANTAHIINIMDLTAILLQHKLMDKELVFQLFSENFIENYEKLKVNKNKIPGLFKTGPELISKEFTLVYKNFKNKNRK